MTKTDLTEKTVLETVKKHNMFMQNDRVLVGLSGGKDSVALLYLLNKYSAYFGISLVAFHLNHGIRGEEALRDENFSREMCQELNIEFVSQVVDVPSIAEELGESIEVAARKTRYEYFEKIASANKCNKIATAHTASDNSETYFITLLRNSNPKCIPPVRDNIVRPLIELSTDDVLQYCTDNELKYIFDSTNNQNEYLRNFIRNEIMPRVYSVNPSFDKNIGKTFEMQHSYEKLCELQTNKYYDEAENPLSLESLKALCSDDAYSNVVYKILQQEAYKNSIEISYQQFESVKSLILYGGVGQKVTLNKGYFFVREYDVLSIKKDSAEPAPYEFLIAFGANKIPDSDIVLYLETLQDYNERITNKNIKINKLTKNILIKYNIMNKNLYARSRRVGDSYVCGGISRNIKKYMINEKIPLCQRSRIPVVCDSDGIVWVPGLGVSDRLKNSDGNVFSLSIDLK